MKRLSLIVNGFILFLLLGNSSTIFAQQTREFLSKLKGGEWIEFEGTPQPDRTIIVKEIEVLRGELEYNDWEIKGKITRVDPAEKMAYILNLPIKFDEKTDYDDNEYHIIKSFSDVKPGMSVEIEGQYLKDGIFLAEDVKTEYLDDENNVEWRGKIETVNPDGNTINILGHTIVLINKSQIKSIIPEF